jgi:hypothetical protein
MSVSKKLENEVLIMQSPEVKELLYELENILYGFEPDELLAYLNDNIEKLENKWFDIQFIVDVDMYQNPSLITKEERRLIYLYLLIMRFWASRN